MGQIVESKNLSDLIIEGAKMGKRSVMVTFVPPYDDPSIKNMKTLSPDLINELKKSKTELFDIINESLDLHLLMKSPNVQKIEWI